jgi:predicted transposase YdaD
VVRTKRRKGGTKEGRKEGRREGLTDKMNEYCSQIQVLNALSIETRLESLESHPQKIQGGQQDPEVSPSLPVPG